jgi:elongation factor G
MPAATRHPKARTVALVGRSGTGKTTLLESLAVAAGTIERPGRVEDGTAIGGSDPEERKHTTSLSIAMAPIFLGEDKLTILDTPGSADFHSEVERALEIADVVVLVVHAADAITTETEVVWTLARDAGVPVIVFVNALDAERANFETTLAGLERLIGPTLAPLELPIGLGAEFSGVVDLLADEAITYGSTGAQHGPVPDGLADLEHRVRSSLVEAIVVGDDSLTERYLEGDALSMDELEGVLGHLMASGSIVPVTCGSALKSIGVDRLATLLDEVAESRPIPVRDGGVVTSLARDPDAEPVARAFKVTIDPYVGRIVVLEVISGTITVDLSLTNPRTRGEEKLHSLNYAVGSKLVPVDRAIAGDVVAVAKLNNVAVGDLLCRKGRDLEAVVPPPLSHALKVALAGHSAEEDDKISTALQRLCEEDPSLVVRHDPVSRKLVVDVMGELHLQVVAERLRRRFNVDATTAPPSVQLFETITTSREIEGRLKKQTGGHGQFAVVNLKVEPLEPTAPFEFVDSTVGGSVPRQYIGAVRNGVEKSMSRGGPAGHPVVGLRVTLTDGKSHSVDSSEAAFETAASIGLRSALEESGTVVLERIMAVRAKVPAECLGDVLSDLSGRRGRVIGTEQDEDSRVTVVAHVPESELFRYGLDLRNMTGGRGRAEFSAHHLAEAPKAVLAK